MRVGSGKAALKKSYLMLTYGKKKGRGKGEREGMGRALQGEGQQRP